MISTDPLLISPFPVALIAAFLPQQQEINPITAARRGGRREAAMAATVALRKAIVKHDPSEAHNFLYGGAKVRGLRLENGRKSVGVILVIRVFWKCAHKRDRRSQD